MAVVGGGVTGLAAAWFLRDTADVMLLEASHRLGGKIATMEMAGVPVEAGPDTFLARVPEATDLCRAVGLGDELVRPATGKAWVWTRGRLRPLPEGHVLGVPTAAWPLVRSGVLSPRGMARAALDLVLPRRPAAGPDPSVAEVVRARLGGEILDRLVDPLVGGIHAGRSDGLSLAATAPQLAAGAASRSLVLGLRRQRAARPPDDGPVFLGMADGLGRLVDRLRAELVPAGVEVRTRARVASIRPEGKGWRLTGPDVPAVDVDAVVVTVPAFAAAGLVRAACPAAAVELDAIGYASVAVSTLGYRPAAVAHPLDGSGFLVPRVEGRLMTACTWSTSKWPELRRSGLVLLRPSAGRAGDERAVRLDDDELVGRLHRELAESVGVTEPPVERLVTRWMRAFPQYQPGHAARVAGIESDLAGAMPGVVVAGAAYRGLGIAACVRQAGEAAQAVLAHSTAPARDFPPSAG